MLKQGDLFQSATSSHPTAVLVEVVRTYDKRDIDPDCVESVAIIGMVEVLVLSGSEMGTSHRMSSHNFYRLYSPVQEAE